MSAVNANANVVALDSGARFPLLVADIGGTNARFGWVENAGASLTSIETLICAHYPTPGAAAVDYLQRFHAGKAPARTSIAIASAIGSGPIKVTNSHWVLDPQTFPAEIQTRCLQVFNDFEAIALVLPYLTGRDYNLVGTATPRDRLTMGVIGPGTGLGVAGLVPVRGAIDTWQTVCGEGGHVTLAGADEYQAEILRAARRENIHVSAEQLVSGIGLPALRRAVAIVENLPLGQEMNAEEIGQRGAARTDRLSELTVEVFCGFLGNVAGNLALTLGARGGIFIAGGIVPKLGEFFAQSGFREQFENKGRYREYLSEISTAVITAPYPGLMGLVRNAVGQPDR
jgi:glucokinase